MTKKELRTAYLKARGEFEAGETFVNTYALHLDEMLSGYFSLPGAEYPAEGGIPDPESQP